MRSAPPPPNWQPTGRYRLAPNGDFVILMMQEILDQSREKRWRPVFSADALALIGVEITAGAVRIGGGE